MTAVGSADVAALAEALRRTGKDSKATTRQTLIEAANYLLTEMEVRVPVDSGELRRSLSVRVEADRVLVGPTAPYAGYVEFGTRPHEIKPKKSGGVLVFNAGGQKVYARVVNHPGTKPQPFVRPAFEAWAESLGTLVADANVKVLTEEYRRGAA